MKVWICGNSHTNAISAGLQTLPAPLRDVGAFALGTGRGETALFAKAIEGRIGFTFDIYAERLQANTGESLLDPDALWGFVMGTHTARLYGAGFWKHASVSPFDDPDKQPVTSEVLDACIDGDQRHIRDFLCLAKEVGLRFFVVSCPPPRADHFSITRRGVRPDPVPRHG